jgi:hypothetical protein
VAWHPGPGSVQNYQHHPDVARSVFSITR